MKRIFAAVMVLLCTMMFTVSCGDSKEADKPEDSGVYEVAMLISGKDVEDGAFNQKTWKSVSSFCEKKELTCQYYTSEINREYSPPIAASVTTFKRSSSRATSVARIGPVVW